MSGDAQSMILVALVRLEAGTGAVETGLTRLRSDIMERMDRFEDKLAGIRDEIGVGMGWVDRAFQAADNTREEVRLLGQQVDGMSRQIVRLQTRVDQL